MVLRSMIEFVVDEDLGVESAKEKAGMRIETFLKKKRGI